MRRHGPPVDEPATLGDEVVMKMTQKTLLAIILAVATLAYAYNDLKNGQRAGHDAIEKITALQASDHDVLVKVATGVDILQKAEARRERGATAASHP